MYTFTFPVYIIYLRGKFLDSQSPSQQYKVSTCTSTNHMSYYNTIITLYIT